MTSSSRSVAGEWVLSIRHGTLNSERDVAIKVLKPKYENIADFQQRFAELRQRFASEAQALAQLGKHPNILSIYDFGRKAPEKTFVSTL